jgi:hypothetical protein
MVRQNSTPVEFNRTMRYDNVSCLTSVPAGVVAPVTYAPLLRGDSATGRIDITAQLAEMPKPLENAVILRGQAWFVPRPALPQFAGVDDYAHSYQGKDVTRLGAAAATPPSLFLTTSVSATYATANSYEILKSLGITVEASETINHDIADAYNLICNFRLSAHSSKMTRYNYASENADAWELKPAFWPRNRMHNIVADYEAALVQGSLELDVTAGSIPVTGLGIGTSRSFVAGTEPVNETGGSASVNYTSYANVGSGSTSSNDATLAEEDPNNTGYPGIFSEMTGQTISTTLADIDKARTTQAFAKIMSSYQGHDFSGFDSSDVVLLEFMQGFNVPDSLQQRPWLLANKTVVFGMTERHATDAANQDDSLTVGDATLSLSVNVPSADYGGIIMATVEVLPERIYPRQSDEYLKVTAASDLPDALRDVQNDLPVDQCLNGRVDTAHSTPTGVFGYEPMNAKWKREATRMGGLFQSLTPGAHVTTARTAVWQPEYQNPALTSDHWLAPHPFPQDVFSVPGEDCCIISVRQQITISGITQFGDDLVEDNSEFTETLAEAPA